MLLSIILAFTQKRSSLEKICSLQRPGPQIPFASFSISDSQWSIIVEQPFSKRFLYILVSCLSLTTIRWCPPLQVILFMAIQFTPAFYDSSLKSPVIAKFKQLPCSGPRVSILVENVKIFFHYYQHSVVRTSQVM